jgi:hypothetical protein
VDYCVCDHKSAEHVDGSGRCRRRDSDGEHCGCTVFEHELDLVLDGD